MPTLRQANKEIYWAWKAMKQRCQNQKCKAYPNYGARGITVCVEWQRFEPFCAWALCSGYKKGLDLDRKDNDNGYSPENCRWVSRQKNINNRRKTTILNVRGMEKPRTEWENLLNLPRGIIKSWVSTHGNQYAESRVEEIIKEGYRPRDYSRNHVERPVECLETGQKYRSMKEAARALGINSGNIVRAIRTGGQTGGYHFKAIKE